MFAGFFPDPEEALLSEHSRRFCVQHDFVNA